MAESAIAPSKNRLVSLDVFRGITIAGMVLVNNPGTWGAMYHPLGHAPWDGYTPTDWIFPFFLFIVGVAMTFSFDRRLSQGANKGLLFLQVLRRTLILIMLGWILGAFPDWRLLVPFILVIVGSNYLFSDEWGKEEKATAKLAAGGAMLLVAVAWMVVDFGYFKAEGPRIPGVLERIGVCFFFAALIVMFTKWRGRLIWLGILLVVYYILMKFENHLVPAGYEIGNGVEGTIRDAPADAPYSGILVDYIDTTLFGSQLYRYRPDPEGLLSTIPAIGTVLIGVLTGAWLKTDNDARTKALWMFMAGCVIGVLGWFWGYEFPPNKKIWTSSYVLLMGAYALFFLAFCYVLIDIKGHKRWSTPFVIFGTNAIFVFFASGILARLMNMIQIPVSEEQTVSLKTWIYQNIFQPLPFDENFSSFAFAFCYIFLWLGLTYPLYKKKWFLKV